MNSHFKCAIDKMLPHIYLYRMLTILSIACAFSTIFGLEYTSTNNLTSGCMNDSKDPCTFYKSYSQLGKQKSQTANQGIFNVKIAFVPGGRDSKAAANLLENILFSPEPTCIIVIAHQQKTPVSAARDSSSSSEVTVPCGELRHPSPSLSNAIESSPDAADDKIILYEKDFPSTSGGLLTIRGYNLPSPKGNMNGGTYELIVNFIPGLENNGVPNGAPLLSRKRRQTYGYPTQRYYTSNPYNNYNTNYRARSRVGSAARIGAGIIAAIVICCLLCCGLMTGLCFYCCCRGGRASENLPAWARGMPAVYRSDQPAPTHSGRAEAYDPAPQQSSYPVYPKLDQNYGGQAYPVGTGGNVNYQGYPQARTENDPPGYTPSAPVVYPQR